MKKQALFTLCLTAASALVVTGCATKQEAAEQRAQQEATEITAAEQRETASEVSAEPLPGPTVEPTDAPAPEGQKPAETVRPVHPKPVPYTVTAGDSVSALAVRFGVRQPDILALNPSLRANPSNLRIGQQVMLPPGTDVSKKAQPRPVRKAAPAPANAVVYTVKSGDVLSGIAVRHGVTVKAIKEANGLKKDFITVGQKLTIPGAKKVAKAEPKAAKPKAKTPQKKEAPKAEPKPAEKPAEKPVEAAKPAEAVKPAPAEVVVPAPEGEQAGEEALPPPPPAVTQPAAEAAKPVPATRDYVVQEGEDLVGVALRWGVPLPALRAANGIDESAGNAVAAGTTLKIPVIAE